jgi:LysR family nitrogen assimilation transcriptional regulator
MTDDPLRAYPILAPRIVRHIVRISHPRRPLSAAAEALIAIIADELRLVSSESTMEA